MTTLSLQDRGFLYGDGLFTTLSVKHGQVLCWPEHWQRLQHGCAVLRMSCPKRSEVEQQLNKVCSNLSSPAVVKIIITRGVGGRAYTPPDPASPHLFVLPLPWPQHPTHYLENGIRLRICQTRVAIQPALAGVKHLNRLENVLARSEWQEPDIAEGLMLDTQDYVVEGTLSNIFWLLNQQLYTPELKLCGVAGIMREQVLALAQEQGIPCHTGRYPLSTLYEAEAVFMSNSVIGIWPVRELKDEMRGSHYWTNLRFAQNLHAALQAKGLCV